MFFFRAQSKYCVHTWSFRDNVGRDAALCSLVQPCRLLYLCSLTADHPDASKSVQALSNGMEAVTELTFVFLKQRALRFSKCCWVQGITSQVTLGANQSVPLSLLKDSGVQFPVGSTL